MISSRALVALSASGREYGSRYERGTPSGTLFSSTASIQRKIAPGLELLTSGSTTRTHRSWKRAGSAPVRGQPSRLLVAKNASTKNTEVTTIAAALTGQA